MLLTLAWGKKVACELSAVGFPRDLGWRTRLQATLLIMTTPRSPASPRTRLEDVTGQWSQERFAFLSVKPAVSGPALRRPLIARRCLNGAQLAGPAALRSGFHSSGEWTRGPVSWSRRQLLGARAGRAPAWGHLSPRHELHTLKSVSFWVQEH